MNSIKVKINLQEARRTQSAVRKWEWGTQAGLDRNRMGAQGLLCADKGM